MEKCHRFPALKGCRFLPRSVDPADRSFFPSVTVCHTVPQRNHHKIPCTEGSVIYCILQFIFPFFLPIFRANTVDILIRKDTKRTIVPIADNRDYFVLFLYRRKHTVRIFLTFAGADKEGQHPRRWCDIRRVQIAYRKHPVIVRNIGRKRINANAFLYTLLQQVSLCIVNIDTVSCRILCNQRKVSAFVQCELHQ